MTSNEKLVGLYQSTNDEKLKQKIYNEIYDKNIGLIKSKISEKVCKNNGVDICLDDLYQEAKIALYISLEKYEMGKSRFSTYFTWLLYSRFDHFLRVHVYPLIENEIHIDFSREEMDFDNNNHKSSQNLKNKTLELNPEVGFENLFICDNINMCVNKLKFKEDWHEIVFRYRYGLNKDKIAVRERELADIFNVTQQRIAFICKNYKDKLKLIVLEYIKKSEASDFGLENKKEYSDGKTK